MERLINSGGTQSTNRHGRKYSIAQRGVFAQDLQSQLFENVQIWILLLVMIHV